jgi:hypothetical protein
MLKKWALGVLLGAASFGQTLGQNSDAQALPAAVINKKPSWLVDAYNYKNPQTGTATKIYPYQLVGKERGGNAGCTIYNLVDAQGSKGQFNVGYACQHNDGDSLTHKKGYNTGVIAYKNILDPNYKSSQGIVIAVVDKKIDPTAAVDNNELSELKRAETIVIIMQQCAKDIGCPVGEELTKSFMRVSNIQTDLIIDSLKKMFMKHGNTNGYYNSQSGQAGKNVGYETYSSLNIPKAP